LDVDSDLLRSLAAKRCVSPFPASGVVQVVGKDEAMGLGYRKPAENVIAQHYMPDT